MSDAERETPQQRIAYRAFATVAWLGKTLPTHTGRMLFRWAGTAAYHLLPKVRGVVAANQARVLGREPDDPLVQASTREAFRLYARYWFDAFDVVDWSDERIRAHYVFEGWEHMQAGLDAGTGVIAVLPHMGNWDAAGRAMCEHGAPVVSVAERLKPERLFQLFLRHRQALAMEIHGLSGEGKVGQALARSLKEGHVVALVADRDLTGRGIEVEMFGGIRKLPAGPAMLALSTGAPIVVAALYQTKDGWSTIFRAPFRVEPTGDRRADVTAATQRIADAFEEAISASPPDWHLFQPGWDA